MNPCFRLLGWGASTDVWRWGNTLRSSGESFDIDDLIKEADKKMYDYKKARKKPENNFNN